MAGKKHEENINKIKPENYSPRQIMNTANSFLAAVHMCNKNPTVEMVGWGHPLIVPIVTNAAFACELFLKALLQKNNRLKSSHRLLDLFQALPGEIKDDIISLKDGELFIKELTKISCLFEEWRYIYERQLISLNFKFLVNFAEELSAITNKTV